LTDEVAKPNDARRLAEQLLAGATPEEGRALVDALLSGQVSSIFEKLQPTEPALRSAPADACGFRVRLDLHGAKPPIWRRLELPGDLTLPRVHDVIQAAMGWTNSHLHRFRTGSDHRSPYFVTTFDVDEGDDGVLEDDVRLDQLVAVEGDSLWYEYDFGDGWDHVLTVEKRLDEPPTTVRCIAGRMACPPEDCGGIGGYEELAGWVRSGYDDTRLPDVFEDAAHARDWLPLEWHPDHFDLDEVNSALSVAIAEPVAVTGELAELVEQLERRGVRVLREVLGRPLSHQPADVTDAEAARLTNAYQVFLDVIGDGVTLTGAGYLPPAVVERFAERSGITGWWIGKANREDLTPPVASGRSAARALGLVTVRKGRLTPTAVGTRCRQDPMVLWRHIVGRLPLGTKEFDRHAGWLALAVAGSGAPAEELRGEVSDLLQLLGWRTDRDPYAAPPANSPTLDVLDELVGAARIGRRVTGTDLAVAATARAVIRRG
jgi:hypothetical protein